MGHRDTETQRRGEKLATNYTNYTKTCSPRSFASRSPRGYTVCDQKNSCNSCNSWQVFLSSILSPTFLPICGQCRDIFQFQRPGPVGEQVLVILGRKRPDGFAPGDHLLAEMFRLAAPSGVGDEDLVGQSGHEKVALLGFVRRDAAVLLRKGRKNKQPACL